MVQGADCSTSVSLLPNAVRKLLHWVRNAGLVGPLFYYDLARIAQRGRTTQLRCLYLVILTIALAGLGFGLIPDFTEGIAKERFSSFIHDRVAIARACVLLVLTLQMVALLVITPSYLASAFTEEKERKTLQFLFATGLRDHELVLGKLFGRVALLGTILLVGLPFMSLCLVYGPVDFSFVFVGVAASALALLSMGSISILCSVLSPTTVAAVVSSYGLVIFMNLWFLLFPAVSPILFVTACEERVEKEWRNWEDDVTVNNQFYEAVPGMPAPPRWGGLRPVRPPKVPKPNMVEIRLRALLPFAIMHGLIFLICVSISIGTLRETCLSPGHTFQFPARPPEPVYIPRPDLTILTPEDLAWIHIPDRRTVTVKEPALLWKEMEFGGTSLPASPFGIWSALNLSLATLLGLLITLAVVGCFRWNCPKEQLSEFDAGACQLIGVATMLVMGIWTLLVAFRVAGSFTREREQDTLQALLMLPVEREEILYAKWLGSILRFGLLGYALGGLWLLGLITGVLHPLAMALLFAECASYLAFLAAVGLWISLASRSTLFANLTMVLVLMLCFSGAVAKRAADLQEFRSQNLRWLRNTPETLVNPGYVLHFSAFSWQAVSSIWTREGSEFQRRKVAGQPQPHGREFLRDLAMIPGNSAFFGFAAWVFWRLSRWQFRKAYC